MARWRWLWILPVVCLSLADCDKNKPKKPDATKGTVTGIVLCADTGKPARFATVTLSAAPKKDQKNDGSDPLPATETTITGVDGRFRLEAVEPGRYYAFATLEGYLDPMRGLDFSRLDGLANDRERELDAIAQWKEHLVELTASPHRSTDLSIQIERAAEISGTVTFDDGSPAIGMHFQLLRKAEKKEWTGVGLALFGDWSIDEVSDGHGRFSLTNLPTGEYTVCALMPSESQDAAPRVCLGNTFRRKDAKTVKAQAGETASGAQIVIPLSGLHTVAGTVSALADGHALGKGTVRLLYADDREKARENSILGDGSFSFAYVPEGNYILEVRGAQDAEQKDSPPATADADAAAQKSNAPRRYADKELPVIVMGDVDDLQVQLAPIAPDQPQ
jgi:hypothetical protein